MSELSKRVAAECAVVAFYGIEHAPEKIEAFFNRSVRWFEFLDHPATRLGFSTPNKTGKLKAYPRSSKELQRLGFDGVIAFEMMSPLPEAKIIWNSFFISATYDAEKGGHAFLAARTSILTLDDERFLPTVRDAVLILRPAYGIGFTHSVIRGPTLYVTGMTMAPADEEIPTGQEYEERLRVCRWGDIAMEEQVYRDGILRDVYPQNYLNETHLARRIQGSTFKKWVAEDPKRGQLEPFGDGLWLWSVEPEETDRLRNALFKAGLIFDWHRYV
jgi:hypothetical protein